MEMDQVTIRGWAGLGEPGDEGPVPLQQLHSVWGGCPERWGAETLGGELAAPLWTDRQDTAQSWDRADGAGDPSWEQGRSLVTLVSPALVGLGHRRGSE